MATSIKFKIVRLGCAKALTQGGDGNGLEIGFVREAG